MFSIANINNFPIVTLNKLTKKGLENTGRAKRIRFFLNNNYT